MDWIFKLPFGFEFWKAISCMLPWRVNKLLSSMLDCLNFEDLVTSTKCLVNVECVFPHSSLKSGFTSVHMCRQEQRDILSEFLRLGFWLGAGAEIWAGFPTWRASCLLPWRSFLSLIWRAFKKRNNIKTELKRNCNVCMMWWWYKHFF